MLSEVDLLDWEITGDPVKLYDLKRGKQLVATGDTGSTNCNHFWFHHIDGMYSFCTLLDGTVFHPVVWTEVYKCKQKVVNAK
jgi:hypothetical protein